MKVPTTGTSVFSPVTYAGQNSTLITNAGFPVDTSWTINRFLGGYRNSAFDRLRGNAVLSLSAPTSEAANNQVLLTSVQNGSTLAGAVTETNASGSSYIQYFLQRAPNYFDTVCYTGTQTVRTVSHNLAAVPELMIAKSRAPTGDHWYVYHKDLGNGSAVYLSLADAVFTNANLWNNTTPTASSFTLGNGFFVNETNTTYLAYLFATCPGVSKVFSYTGNGSSQTINCGFTGGARFVLIKRTDSNGDWYVWDTARGIVSGNDPHLSLNTTAAEVTTDDTIDTDSTGFVVNQVAATNVNVSSATYIGLAIA
jgi:hypothetical protein